MIRSRSFVGRPFSPTPLLPLRRIKKRPPKRSLYTTCIHLGRLLVIIAAWVFIDTNVDPRSLFRDEDVGEFWDRKLEQDANMTAAAAAIDTQGRVLLTDTTDVDTSIEESDVAASIEESVKIIEAIDAKSIEKEILDRTEIVDEEESSATLVTKLAERQALATEEPMVDLKDAEPNEAIMKVSDETPLQAHNETLPAASTSLPP